MDFAKEPQRIISMCTGIRGLERGLERVGLTIQPILYLEIEAFIIANLVAGMEAGLVDSAPIWTDAKTFNARPFRGKIHGIIGGYPCTPFSTAGKREGVNDERHLWPYIEKSIEAIRPLWCFFENVDDHLSLGFDIVYKSLSNLGYSIEAGIYSAAEVGAPHERKRLFILAIRKDIELGNTKGYDEWNDRNKSGEPEFSAGRSSDFKLGNSKSIKGRLPIRSRGQEQAAIESIGASKELANADSSGSQQDRQQTELRAISSEQSPGDSGGTYEGEILQEQWQGWPARPGEEQHEWEEPRTVERGVGSTINGYSFREDLLRALGNSVVEQTAELAFKDLIRKHIQNSKK